MFPIRTKNRKALTVILTTLIILVASLILGTGVVLYGTSLFQTGGQTQSISTQGVKLWVNGSSQTGYAWGAVAIRNSGDVLATVNTIQVRSAAIPYSSWYVDTNATQVAPNFQASFISTNTNTQGYMKSNAAYSNVSTCPAINSPATIPNEITINEISFGYSSTMLCLKQAKGSISLTPGQQMIIYF